MPLEREKPGVISKMRELETQEAMWSIQSQKLVMDTYPTAMFEKKQPWFICGEGTLFAWVVP